MEPAEHLIALERDGDLLVAAAARSGLDAPVPTCPDWRVADLVRHTGYVHRWATGHLTHAGSSDDHGATEEEILHGGPPDAALLSWFSQGHSALLATLKESDPALSCWTFFAAPSPLAFWARRQAHETAIHRVDAELAADGISPIDAAFGADGIDEMLTGFAARRRRSLRDSARRTLCLRADEEPDPWLVTLDENGARTVRTEGPAEVTIEGPAASLYLVVWNRLRPKECGVVVEGDESVLQLWRSAIEVRW